MLGAEWRYPHHLAISPQPPFRPQREVLSDHSARYREKPHEYKQAGEQPWGSTVKGRMFKTYRFKNLQSNEG